MHLKSVWSAVVGWSALKMPIRNRWLTVLFSSSIALLIFSLPGLITKEGMLKSPTISEHFPSLISVFALCILKLYRFSISG